ncbi:MAG: ECF transporter S component [Candidatus Wallbacteria bacterium]|nr:ECF transporter S component [Candidatus Wallbacteria bacterium]
MNKTRRIATLGMLCAMSFLLMLAEIPLFPAYPHLKYDLSDVIPLMTGLYDSLSGCFLVLLVRTVCHLLLKPAQPPLLGEAMSFIAGASFTLPAVFVYSHARTRSGALSGMALASISLVLTMLAANAFIVPRFIPFLADHSTLFPYLLYGVLPFNAVKALLNCLVVFFFYKRFSRVFLRGMRS